MIAASIVGVGVVTPAGHDPTTFWGRLLAGTPCARPSGPRSVAGWSGALADVRDFDALAHVPRHEERRLDRTHLMAVAAADQAVATIGERPDPSRCALVVGSGFGASAFAEAQYRNLILGNVRRITPLTIPVVMTNSIAAHLSLRLTFRGPAIALSTACASGADAIGAALDLLRLGRADLVVAGGVDALITPAGLAFFARMEAMSRAPDGADLASRPFDTRRDGFVLAEGAAFVALARATDTTPCAEVPCRILGYASTSDAHHIVAPPESGAVAARCIIDALRDAGVGPHEVGHVNAHGTSTALNDRSEARAIRHALPHAPPVTSSKGCTGHMIGASGAAEVIATALALDHGVVPPTAGLREIDPAIDLDVVNGEPRPLDNPLAISNSFGFGGHNATIVVEGAR